MDYRSSSKGVRKLRLSALRKKSGPKKRRLDYPTRTEGSEPNIVPGIIPDDSEIPIVSEVTAQNSTTEQHHSSSRPTLFARRKKRYVNAGLLQWRRTIRERRTLNETNNREPVVENNEAIDCGGANDVQCVQTNSGSFPALIGGFPSNSLGEEPAIAIQEPESNNDLQLPELTILRSPNPLSNLDIIKGKFIIDGLHFVRELRSMENHYLTCKKSFEGHMKLMTSNNASLNWRLVFECPYCKEVKIIESEPKIDISENVTEEPHPTNLNIKEKAVWGFSAIGSGHRNMEEVFSTMGLNSITPKTFRKTEMRLSEVWQKVLFESMLDAGREERRLAIENGDVENGVPYITVVVDGGWSHRSHGHRYTANSGVACVIGLRTKKLLHADVRNKYCSMCNYLLKHNKPTQHEKCFKNWDGPSPSMETDMIVQAFRKSEEIHGLQYRRMIGDGDSSVFVQVQQNVSYGRKVEKWECANHVVKNYTKRLYEIQKSVKGIKGVLNGVTIQHLKSGARKAIVHNASQGSYELLKRDLKNGPDHVFGNHQKCRDYFCSKPKVQTELQGVQLQVYKLVHTALQPVLLKTNSLIYNNTSNLAETFMSLVAKFCGGKQINRGKRGSFLARTRTAGLDFQYGPLWHCKTLKKATGISPPSATKRVAFRRLRISEACLRSRQKCKPVRRLYSSTKATGKEDYGPLSQQIDMEESDFNEQKDIVLASLSLTPCGIRKLEEETRGQGENPLWFKERANRLTASNFGKVVVRRKTSKWAPLVDQLLYKSYRTDAMTYGILHESIAVDEFTKATGLNVMPCGLFVDKTYGFLGASPDGKIEGQNAIIEVKCPKSAAKYTILEAAQKIKSFCLNKDLKLKKTHNYYYQVQGQLRVTGADKCYFVVYAGKDIHVEEIERDDGFWAQKMEKKLVFFYLHVLLPEIVDPRKHRSMPIREPSTLNQP